MEKEILGKIAGFIVFASAWPYMIRVAQGKIITNPASWAIWSLGSIAMLLNYKTAGAQDAFWPTVGGCINPNIVFLLTLYHRKKNPGKDKLKKRDYVCLGIGIVAIAAWVWIEKTGHTEYAQYVVLLAIAADILGAIPTFLFLSEFPWKDRPFMWTFFGIGYLLGLLAVPVHNFANDTLLIYMFVMASTIAYPLVMYRIRIKEPLRNWV